VVTVGELGVDVSAAVVLGTVPVGAVVVAAAAGVVVVGTAPGAVVVGADPVGAVVDVAGTWVAGEADPSALATTTPTEVLAPCCDRLPTKLASGCWATASTPVITPTAIPNAATAATATRRQRSGRGGAVLAVSSPPPASWPTRRSSELRARGVGGRQRAGVQGFARGHHDAAQGCADEGPVDPEEGGDDGRGDGRERASEQLGNAELLHTTPEGWGWDGGSATGTTGPAGWGPRRHLQESACYRPGPPGAS
jgi:hypothetical protein